MASSDVDDKIVAERQIEGYVAANLVEQFSLMKTGIVMMDLEPGFSADINKGGNTFQIKGRIRDTGAWDSPAADTAPTPNAITSWYQKGVVTRKIKLYGNEDFASLAGSEDKNAWRADLGRIMAHNQGINLEKLYFQKLIYGTYNATNGVLYSTHCVDNSTDVFAEYMFTQALALMGENSGLLDTVIMHSSVYWKNRINLLLTETPVPTASVATREALATTFVGRIGNLSVYLNDRVYNSGGVYDTIVAGPGALYFGTQLAYSVEIFPRSTKAGGTDQIMYKMAFSPAVNKVSWNGTLSDDTAGASDAEIALGTNWAAVSGAAVQETPLVVIKSKAE